MLSRLVNAFREMPQKTRGRIYRAVVAAQPVLVSWGLLGDSEAAFLTALASAVLGVGLAAVKTPTKQVQE